MAQLSLSPRRRRSRVQSLSGETLSGTEPQGGDALGYRASGRRRSRVQSLRKELTVLELSLYSQVLPQQVHHHSLHVSSDATAVPRQREEGIDK